MGWLIAEREDAELAQQPVAWYNTMHRHSGIGYMTPDNVQHGQAEQLRSVRQAALDDAFRAAPIRFKGRRPEPHALPTAAWINPPPLKTINPAINTTLRSKFMTNGGAKSLTRSGRESQRRNTPSPM